jgi:hydrogenase-4 component B
MVLLIVICLGLGVLATGVIPVLGRLVAPLIGIDASAALVPDFFHGAPTLAPAVVADLTHIGARIGHGVLPLPGLVVLHSSAATPVVFAMSTGLTFAVIAFLLLVVWVLVRVLRRRRVNRTRLWDAGLPVLRPDMTYTATAFASPVRVLFDAVLQPVVSSRRYQQGAFVTGVRHEESSTHIVERWVIKPVTRIVTAIANVLARLHHGRVTHYAAYVLVTLLVTLLIAAGLS